MAARLRAASEDGGERIPCAAGICERLPRLERGEDKSDGNTVRTGDLAPDFSLPAIDGTNRRLSDFRGRKVMLCFYRHPYCPICAYTLNKLIGNYRKLAWATRLEVITIFAAPVDVVADAVCCKRKSIERQGKRSTILGNRGECQYPFLALADPSGDTYDLYRVGSRSIFGCMKDALPFRHALAMLKTARTGDSSVSILPSEVLIDEEGIIVDIYRAKTLSDSIPMERMENFLLFGTRTLPQKGKSTARGTLIQPKREMTRRFVRKRSMSARF